jgi:3D (Asp-Asp-Asp) domain-containing protein
VAITATLSAAAPATDSFTWTLPAGIVKKTQTANPTASSVITFDAPVIPLGTVVPTVLAFSVFAGSGASQSDVVGASVTVR